MIVQLIVLTVLQEIQLLVSVSHDAMTGISQNGFYGTLSMCLPVRVYCIFVFSSLTVLCTIKRQHLFIVRRSSCSSEVSEKYDRTK